jgi:hypothetical protein
MNASTPAAGPLVKDVNGIRARYQSVHNALGHQYLFAGCECGARTAHNASRANILEPLVVVCVFCVLNLSHIALDITYRGTEVHG